MRAVRAGVRMLLPALCAMAAAFAASAHADGGSVYRFSYTLGQDALSPLDSYSATGSLRPGFRNDIRPARELSLGVRSASIPSAVAPGLSERSLETSGGLVQRFGDTGLGYGLDVGLGLYSSGWDNAVEPGAQDPNLAMRPFLLSDVSVGTVYEAGAYTGRLRVGVRHPLSGNAETGLSLLGHRGDAARSAGYLSLDGRLRFSQRREMSISLFYDEYVPAASDDWLRDALDFRGGSGGQESVFGFEMGLNF